ncbi:MAG: flagellin [Lachnospiraceae bacterium]|nr:flagellin [Lachnospiraceae bacterium]
MRVQHNMGALNANRQLGINVSNQSKVTEKLSSGYRINRAGDDAAGLAISEKMRSQIRGLEMASKNAQDGISMIQTAEGALNETHSILQRMNELATQCANDTYLTKDRDLAQKEITQLIAEIDRIASNTEFNEMKLLTGSCTGKNLQVGAKQGQVITFSIDSMSSSGLSVGSISISSQAGAAGAMTTIQNAIVTVATQRADLGAIQNRLEHTIASVDTTAENLTASESRIRDTDMAKEMVTYSKNNILQQAAQSMLASANQSTSGVLSLLQ